MIIMMLLSLLSFLNKGAFGSSGTSEREQASYREAQEEERAKAHNRPAKMLKVSNDGEASFHCC